jgi:hypothetical protein
VIPNLSIVELESAPPPLPDASRERVELWHDDRGVVCAYGGTEGGRCCMHFPGFASYTFDRESEDVTASAPSTIERDVLIATFHRAVLPMVLQVREREVLHASGVCVPRGVVAFCARSGTGKSTLAFGLGRRGYRVWADDAVAFTACGPQVHALSLPFALRLRPDAAACLSADRMNGDGARDDEVTRAESPVLAAVAVLERVDRLDGMTRVERLRPSAAFPALLAHAYCFSLREAERRRRMVQRYLDLTERVPVFVLRVESGLECLPATLDAIAGAPLG